MVEIGKPKSEALRAVESVQGQIKERAGLTLDTLQVKLLSATLEYALEQIAAIQEVKRVRKLKPEEQEAAE